MIPSLIFLLIVGGALGHLVLTPARHDALMGGGFVMPDPLIDTTLGDPDDRIHKAPPGPERGNFRSATPMGFARAVFEANAEAARAAA